MACVRFRRGRWIIDFYDQEGIRRLHTMPKGSSRKDANVKKGELEKKVQKKTYRAPETMPLFPAVADDWLRSKVNIRDNTREGYQGHIEKHLKPAFEDTKINRITLAVVEQFREALLKNGTTVATTKKILTTLSQIMKYAVKHHYQDYNPITDLERLETPHSEEDEDLNILQPEQINTLIETATDQRDRMLYMTGALTGMRQGELFGLKWSVIDWINKQVHIKRTYNHGKFYKPKSRSSRRSIDLAPQLMDELKKWKLACPKAKLDLVFPNEVGKPEHSSNFTRRRFHPALVAAKLPQIRFHDLRHTYAALLIDQGENMKYIQRQLGHSSIRVTMDIYGHLLSDVNHEAATKLGNRVLGKAVANE
jgi:integrase